MCKQTCSIALLLALATQSDAFFSCRFHPPCGRIHPKHAAGSIPKSQNRQIAITRHMQRAPLSLRMDAQNKDLVEKGHGKCDSAVRRYWKGMNERNVELALAQFADDIVFQVCENRCNLWAVLKRLLETLHLTRRSFQLLSTRARHVNVDDTSPSPCQIEDDNLLLPVVGYDVLKAIREQGGTARPLRTVLSARGLVQI